MEGAVDIPWLWPRYRECGSFARIWPPAPPAIIALRFPVPYTFGQLSVSPTKEERGIGTVVVSQHRNSPFPDGSLTTTRKRHRKLCTEVRKLLLYCGELNWVFKTGDDGWSHG